MPSRRTVLTAIAGGSIATLAGCADGSNSGNLSDTDCHTSARAHGDGDVLNGGAMATAWDDERVRLSIPLDVEQVRDTGMVAVDLYVGDTLDHRIPVSPSDATYMGGTGVSDGQLRYEHTLGDRPLHGEYRLVAIDGSGTELDEVTIAFNCFAENEE